jgi:DNA-binding CsgD family transcriptional regulator
MRRPPRPSSDAPLLEREREQTVLHSAVGRVSDGSGSLVIVEGPAGIGKTRLLQELARVAGEGDLLVRVARGGEMEEEMPFGIARQWFEPLLTRATGSQRDEWLSGSAQQALAALAMVEAEGERSAGDPFTAINGLYWLAANLSLTRPVLLVLDDAQLADAPSLRFTTFLARRLADVPIAVVVAVRSGEPDEPAELEALRNEGEVLTLPPLSPDGVRELIAGHAGSPPDEAFSDACVSATAGNPFLVIEIMRELSSEQRRLDADAAADIVQLAPSSVARNVLFRLRRFGDDAVALARAVAIFGRAPQLRHVAQLACLTEEQALSAADDLRRAEVLAAGSHLDFVHPLVRRAIYEDFVEGERYAAHRKAADLLASAGAASVEVAAHLLVCPPNGDPWVAARLEDAADAAIDEGAFDVAVTYLRRALAEPPLDDLGLLSKVGMTLTQVDVFEAPVVLAEVAARTTGTAARVEALRRLATSQLGTGNLAGAAATFDEAIELIGGSNREVLLDLEGQRYFASMAPTGRGGEETLARIEAVAASLDGRTTGERIARQALAMKRYVCCAPVTEVLDLILPFPKLPWQRDGIASGVTIAAPKILAWSGRWNEAREEWARWVELEHTEGRVLSVAAGYSFLAEVDRLGGRLLESEGHARTAWEITQGTGGTSAFGWSALMNLAATLLARGDLEGFDELVGGMDLSLGPLEIPVNPWPLELRAALHLVRGDLEAGLRDLLRLGELMEGPMYWLNPAYPPWRQEAAETLAALGRTAEASELLGVAEERAITFGAPHTIAGVLRARAMIEPRRRSIATLGRSVEILEAAGPPHELARSLLALGGALRRAGDRGDAREALEKALEIAHRCGAAGLDGRIREELAATGARPRKAVRTGVDALTVTELKIAQLAAIGHTNKEIAERLFVTVRTVETHLTHAYEKLGIRGRRRLAVALSGEA